MKNYNKRLKQSGAVSLFVVIFAALLMTIVTLSFIQLMVKDQRQATASDLSQSAYDSAQAGVEDAKRLLLINQSCQSGVSLSGVNCTAVANALTPSAGQSETACNTLAQSGIVGEANNETIIQQSTGDNAEQLDQAYTCVKVKVNTDDYKGSIGVNELDIVPISGVGAFDAVELKWFSRADISSATNNPTVGFPSSGGGVDLPPVGSKWQFNYPPLMRTQLIQLGSSFTLTDFDDQSDGKSNANTLFLYPSLTGVTDMLFSLDARRSPLNAPHQVKCVNTFDNGEYACTVLLHLPAPIDGSVNRNAYLRLSGIYNGAHYSIKLKNGATDVQFAGVQPEVDSTGRANDLFRRVKARIELKGDFPEASFDLAGSLCKSFTVTDQEDGFSNQSNCTP